MLLKSVLADCVTATVNTFDGFTNQLSIMLPNEMGGGCLDDLILSQLEILKHARLKKINNQAATDTATTTTTKEVSSPATPTIVDGRPQPSTPTNPITITKVLEGHPTSPTTITKFLEGHATSPTTITKVLEEHPTTTPILGEVSLKGGWYWCPWCCIPQV